MTLSPGTRIGPYEILSAIGAGGMGEVYRARDTKLGRSVAIKILPELFATDPERLARFEREATLLAALNHPNIAQIYGVEDGSADPGTKARTRALVLELVEGTTLAELLEPQDSAHVGHRVPVEQCLAIARQIAEALEAAHEQAIIHRDLKPANIKLRPDGAVKVLDFGLAKAFDMPGIREVTPASAALSTVPSPAAMTREGLILGTASYMSPEHARGRSVDKRADIWAFGCVFYEMLAGRRAFDGETINDVVAAVLTRDPDWTLLPASTPRRAVNLIRRCLMKDPRERLRDIGDARLEIQDILAEPDVTTDPELQAATRSARSLTMTSGFLAAGALAIGVAGTWAIMSRPLRTAGTDDPQGRPTVRSIVELSADAPVALGAESPLIGYDSNVVAISHDGSHVSYVGRTKYGTMLYLRPLASADARQIPGTNGAISAFFSHDGRSLAFLTNDKVKKVALDGSPPVTLCDARAPVRGTWAADGSIYFGESEGSLLSRVSGQGGSREELVSTTREGRLAFSDLLPDGRWALFTRWERGISADYASVVAVSLATRETRVILERGYDARYVAPGYLIFARAGNLMTVRFNPGMITASGEAVPVASGVSMESLFGQMHAAASGNGLLVYVPGGDRATGRLAWVGRDGRTELLDASARLYGALDLSARGDRLAVQVADVTDYVWVYDFARREGKPLSAAANAGWPIWSPDGQRVAFVTGGGFGIGMPWQVVISPVDGSAPPRQLMSEDGLETNSWSPDGHVLAVTSQIPSLRFGFLSIGGSMQWVPEEQAIWPHFSPDGKWVAYASIATGQIEILIRSYPDGRTIRHVSSGGGAEPIWISSGELFYRRGDQWMSTRVTTSPELRWDPPRLAFQTTFVDTPGRSYDVSPDGKRLLVVKPTEANTPTRLHLVSNWPQLSRTP